MTTPAPTTFIFAGGGTGGHIFPALAIREHLPAGSRTLLIVSDRPLDARILHEHGAEFVVTHAKPLGLSPNALARFVWHWGGAVRRCREVLRRAKAQGPVHMVAMGGFVAAPAAQAARVERVPLTMVNLDAAPGKANRLIARIASRVFTAAPTPTFEAKGWARIPPIVRSAALPAGDAAHCRRALGLDPEKPVLMVTGASQGASSLNHMLIELARQHPDALKGWQILHQTGKSDTEECAKAYAQAGVPAVVRPFVQAMGLWWGAAELALARSGAGSVAEAWASRTPTIFMPYPWHKDQHQLANAMPLVEADGALIATDHIDPRRNLADGGARLLSILGDPSSRTRMRRGLESLGPADGAARVAAEISRR